jgi:hypothetical protein
MITNLGWACGRVLRNIKETNPSEVIYFHQDNPLWNEKNPDYANAISIFKTDPKIQDYERLGKLKPKEISSITNYADLFDALADIIEENEDEFERIYLDCTGFPKGAVPVVLHLAGIYDNVYPIYNRSTISTRYIAQRDSLRSSDEGEGPEQLPFTKIKTDWINKPESSEYQLLKAAWSLVEKSTHPRAKKWNHKFSEKDLKDELEKMGGPLSTKSIGEGPCNIRVGKAIPALLDSGFFMKAYDAYERLRLSLPGYVLARRVFGMKRSGA